MSKSFKKAVVKDRIRNGNPASAYHKPIRRVQKQYIKQLKYDDEIEIPHPKTIINDYDYCDTIYDYEYTLIDDDPGKDDFKKEQIKNRRK